MKLLKRPELWLLLALVGGAIALVLSTGGNEDGAASPSREANAPTETASEAPFTIDASHLKRDYGNAILEIHLTYTNEADSPLELSSPTARLLAGPDPDDPRGAEEVSPFFLAFAPPPSIPAGETDGAVLKYWLEGVHLESALWLRIEDDSLPVKTEAPLDLEAIPNQEIVVYTTPDWES